MSDRTHQAREYFAKLITNRNVRLSLDGVQTWRGSGPGLCYLHADNVFVGAVNRRGWEIGGTWVATLQARKISRSIKGVPDCYPYLVGTEHMTMWGALIAMLLEHDWRTGATARPGRREKRSA